MTYPVAGRTTVPFESHDWPLGDLLSAVADGRLQLPDFQRDWKWDDDRIASLLSAISLGYPIGVVMTLETVVTGHGSSRSRSLASHRTACWLRSNFSWT